MGRNGGRHRGDSVAAYGEVSMAAVHGAERATVADRALLLHACGGHADPGTTPRERGSLRETALSATRQQYRTGGCE